MTLLNFTDNAPAIALAHHIDSAEIFIDVETSGGYPAPPFEFAIDLATAPELCLCLQVVSNTQWKVARGWDGSTAVDHDPAPGQITLITSAEFWTEANTHITQDPYQHVQYMRADGTGHDLPQQHGVGEGEYVAINTDNEWETQGSTSAHAASFVLQNRFAQQFLDTAFDPAVLPYSHWGDTGFDGLSIHPANGGHVHARESEDELQSSLWPPGVLALWGGRAIPPGWLPCDGRDVRTDLAPLCFEQWGYTCGTAISWYPAPPVFPTYIAYQLGNYTDPNSQAQLQLQVPYSYMADPTKIAMQLPYGEPTYFKVPNIAPPVPGLTWIIRVDYGYTWSPRPAPPPPLPIYCAPFAVDRSIPAVTFSDHVQILPSQWLPGASGSKLQEDVTVGEAPHPTGTFRTNLTWGFDAASGLPVINGTDYTGPGQTVTGPIAVPVYPYGQAVPQGFSLLHPPQPAYQVGPPIVMNEELVQLYALRVNVENGYGWALTNIPWTRLASAPWCNASYPPVDGNYLNGIAQVQQRNNMIAVTVSKMAFSNPGVPDTPFNGAAAVFFFIYNTS